MSDRKNPVSADSPKTLLIHGTHALMTPIEAHYLLYEKMQEVGSDVTFLALAFVDHAFDSMMNKDSVVIDKAFEEVMPWLLVGWERVQIGKWRKPRVPNGAGRIRILINRLHNVPNEIVFTTKDGAIDDHVSWNK